MQKPNITPGPWKVERYDAALTCVEAGPRGHIGICSFRHDKEDADFVAAHAKAIAALPECLSTLEDLLPDWHSADDSGISNGMIAGEVTYGDLRKIKSALTKAGYTF